MGTAILIILAAFLALAWALWVVSGPAPKPRPFVHKPLGGGDGE